MPDNKLRKREQKKVETSHLILLFFILLLSAFLTYYPHLNYPYPLHVDEWYHIYVAEHIARFGSPSQLEIYTARFSATDVEQGFHYLLALVYAIFSPAITQWLYLPILFELIAVLSVYYSVSVLFGDKEALVAALLIALLPSNVTIGGPAFLIPANLSLIFLPLAFLFLFDLVEMKPILNDFVLFLILLFLLYAHPPTAMILLVLVIIYAILSLLSMERSKAKRLFAIAILAMLLSIPNYLRYIQIKSGIVNAVQFNFGIYANEIPSVYGIPQTLLFLAGFYLLATTEDKKSLSLLLTTIVLILTIFVFANFNLNFIIPYQRVYIPLFLFMSVVASRGYIELLSLNKKNSHAGTALFILFLLVTLALSIQSGIAAQYYHVINQQDYQSFLWIKNNLNSAATAVLDPWRAKAFGPITGIRVYSVIPFEPNPSYLPLLNSTYAFFLSNCTDTRFLIRNNISIVYTSSTCQNANLTLVNTNTYTFTLPRH